MGSGARARQRSASRSKAKGRRFVPVEEAEGQVSARVREILGLMLLALGLFLTISALSYQYLDPGAPARSGPAVNWGGAIGYQLASFFLNNFGLPAFLFFGFVIYWALLLFLHRELPKFGLRLFGALVLTMVFSIFLAGPELSGLSARTPMGHGGGLGHLLAPRLHASFGSFGTSLLLLLTAVVAFLIASDWAIYELVEDLRGGLLRKTQKPRPKLKVTDAKERPSRISAALKRGLVFTGRYTGKASLWTLTGLRHSFAKIGKGLQALAPDDGEAAVALADDGPTIRVGNETAPAAVPAKKTMRTRKRGPEAEDADSEVPSEASATEGGASTSVPSGSAGGKSESGNSDAAGENAAQDAEHESAEGRAAVDRRAEARRKRAEARAARHGEEEPSLYISTRLPKRRGRARPKKLKDYVFPPIDLLEVADESGNSVATRESLKARAVAIEKRLASHRVDVRVVSISAGPAVTVFELEVGEGQRIASLTRFAPDLAAALRALSVRIVAPIPGKATVGVEVPNEKRSLVHLRELLEAETVSRQYTVPLLLGRDVAGKPMIEDLARMPHLLIAGATGSGKSVCINSILLSIMMTKSPEEVRLILIDPKMVELQNFSTIPHLLCPVVTNMKKASGVLAWAVETMEKRYALLSAASVRNLKDYNGLGEEKLRERLGVSYDPEEVPAKLPSIVVIIDEFADLMTVAAADVEVSIQRLAQKSRAVGIHVILATQRPSRDVITGLIKANLPTRLAFQVSNRVDSRVILDANGADQLLGHGDMLYIPPGTNRLVRAQGTFVSDDEIHATVSFLEQNVGGQDFSQELTQVPSGSGRGAKERDDLYEDAVRCVLEEQRGSATLLQRKLSVGYTRASRLIEIMAEDGIVGDYQGSKSREVLLTLEEWEAQNEAVPEDEYEDEGYEEAPYEDEAGVEEASVDEGGGELGIAEADLHEEGQASETLGTETTGADSASPTAAPWEEASREAASTEGEDASPATAVEAKPTGAAGGDRVGFGIEIDLREEAAESSEDEAGQGLESPMPDGAQVLAAEAEMAEAETTAAETELPTAEDDASDLEEEVEETEAQEDDEAEEEDEEDIDPEDDAEDEDEEDEEEEYEGDEEWEEGDEEEEEDEDWEEVPEGEGEEEGYEYEYEYVYEDEEDEDESEEDAEEEESK